MVSNYLDPDQDRHSLSKLFAKTITRQTTKVNASKEKVNFIIYLVMKYWNILVKYVYLKKLYFTAVKI